MIRTNGGKKIAVISDDDRLTKLMTLALKSKGWCVLEDYPGSLNQAETHKNDIIDLVIVALSLPTSEPIVELSRTSLAKFIGQIPLLIISDRQFQVAEGEMVHRLGFPFNMQELQEKVAHLLHANSS